MRLAFGITSIVFLFLVATQGVLHADPQKGRVAFRRGAQLYKQGKVADALSAFETSFEEDGNATTLYQIGLCQHDLGNLSGAQKALRKYLLNAPGGVHVADARALLAEIDEQRAAAYAAEPPPPPAPIAPAPVDSAPPPVAAADSAATSSRSAKPKSNSKYPKYGIGLRIRAHGVPSAFLAPYLAASTGMVNPSMAIEFSYHREKKFDVVTSLDFSFFSPSDGNYLGKNNINEAMLKTYYVNFRNLNFVSLDVALIGHHSFNSWAEIIYGGGLGIGLVLGDVLLTHNAGCTAENVGDTTACHPLGITLNQPGSEAKLKATENGGTADSPDDPHRHVSTDKPPVMGVVNLLIGARFKVQEHMRVKVEVGFRNALFAGVGAEYVF